MGHWNRSHKRAALVNLIKAAPIDGKISIQSENLDKDKYLFNCSNGTINLRSGELLPHNRMDYITKMTPVAYDSESKYPIWMKFLSWILFPA